MIKGSIVALITPMNNDGTVDYSGLEKLVEFHVAQGTDGIVSVGTTGESATLPVKEHIDVVSRTVKFAAGRLAVIAGNGANSTAEAVNLSKALEQEGVDAMLSVTPYYNKPPQRGLIAHYQKVAASTEVPQILYNVPGRTAVDMLPETIAELAAVPNIIGVKEATGDTNRVKRLRELCGAEFKLLSGDDATACDFLLAGGDGVISVTNNLVPKAFKAMCDAAVSANADLAKTLDLPLRGLHNHLFCEANPIPVKWAAYKMGLITTDYIRLPLVVLAEQYQSQLIQAMRQANIEV